LLVGADEAVQHGEVSCGLLVPEEEEPKKTMQIYLQFIINMLGLHC
jgi:hypothetical protein